MAEELMMTIGPAGQPPTTTYTYDSGSVTLSPRAASVRAPQELRTIVARIDAFARAVRAGAPPTAPLDPPINFRYRKQNANPLQILAQFRASQLMVEATIDTTSRVTSFAARDGATIQWSDFVLFSRWMSMLYEFVTRETL